MSWKGHWAQGQQYEVEWADEVGARKNWGQKSDKRKEG